MGRVLTVTAEYQGRRYVIDGWQSNWQQAEKIAEAWRQAYPYAAFYVCDRSCVGVMHGFGFNFLEAAKLSGDWERLHSRLH